MTSVYFVRHAEANNSDLDTINRELTPKGVYDCRLVTEFLVEKNIDIIYSSPYRRSLDTVSKFSIISGLEINIVNDFRERESSSLRLSGDEYISYLKRMWEDFSYIPSGEEDLLSVQTRNIESLNNVLEQNRNSNIVVATHGVSLSTIISYYDKSFSFEDFYSLIGKLPYIVRADFNGFGCIGMQSFDLFVPTTDRNANLPTSKIAELNSLKAYRYVVILSRYENSWVFCRAKERQSYETAGGHIEEGETPLEAAKRELFEETGATAFDIFPIFDYSIHHMDEWSNGQVFYSEIKEIGDMPPFEMAEILLSDTLPENMRFPSILPVLFDEIKRALSICS